MHEAVGARLGGDLLSPLKPIFRADDLDQLVDADDAEARAVLNRVNARKPVEAMFRGVAELESEVVQGHKVVVERGKLGLAAVVI
jgi:hypothetical protein